MVTNVLSSNCDELNTSSLRVLALCIYTLAIVVITTIQVSVNLDHSYHREQQSMIVAIIVSDSPWHDYHPSAPCPIIPDLPSAPPLIGSLISPSLWVVTYLYKIY